MSERGMPDIMPQRNGFDEILVQPQKTPDGPCDFRNQLNMQHPVGNMIVV